MPDYIPRNEMKKMHWLKHFADWLDAHGAAHGIPPADIAEIVASADEAADAITAHVQAHAVSRGATARKNNALALAVERARSGAMRLQASKTVTDSDRADAGITVRDPNRTPAPPEEILSIPPPLLLLDFSVHRQVIIHWGPNPANEHENARPAGTIGCEIQIARGGIPLEESAWTVLGSDTQSPMFHTVDESAPTTFAYRARYIGKRIQYGPYSDVVTCTVSV